MTPRDAAAAIHTCSSVYIYIYVHVSKIGNPYTTQTLSSGRRSHTGGLHKSRFVRRLGVSKSFLKETKERDRNDVSGLSQFQV